MDGTENITNGCEPIINGDEVNGNIALIYRGDCSFVQKVLNAQDVGAVAVIVVNNIAGDGFFDMGGNSNDIEIPSVMVSFEDGELLAAQASGVATGFNLGFDDSAVVGITSCPEMDGSVFIPAEPLIAFTGQQAQGIWTLELEDFNAGNGGELTSWDLQVCFAADDISSINSLDAGDIAAIYPNPTSDRIFIALTDGVRAERVDLIDISGRIIFSNLAPEASSLSFDISRQAAGLYFVRIAADGFGSQVFKVLKSN